ncbi:MAG: galactose oxidase [Crocinitomicaceae bacterium]|nr:galactose oxidase [Crocinitomicaceae bacterium]
MTKTLLYIVLCCALMSTDTCAQTWNQKSNIPTIARHRSTAFSIGNKGYICLGHLNTVSNILYEDLWEYNPASNAWTQKADFGGGLRYHAHGFVINGKAYVGTGRDGSSYQDDNWEYDPATNMWTQKADIIGPNRRGTVSFVINDIGYVGSGLTSGGGGSSNNFYAYDPPLDQWTTVANFPGNSRNSAVGFAIGDKGYMGTGDLGGVTGSKDFWEYDPVGDLWTQKADCGDSVRRQATGFSLNGYGYIGCGHHPFTDDDVDDFWKYNPTNDTWEEVEDFLGVSRRYPVAFVIAYKAYVGIGTNGINFNDLWEYNPNYLPAKPQFDNVTLNLTETPNGSYKFTVDDFSGSHSDLFLVVSNKEGQIIQEIPVTHSGKIIESNQLPSNCIYKLVKDGSVVKSGKVKITNLLSAQ